MFIYQRVYIYLYQLLVKNSEVQSTGIHQPQAYHEVAGNSIEDTLVVGGGWMGSDGPKLHFEHEDQQKRCTLW